MAPAIANIFAALRQTIDRALKQAHDDFPDEGATIRIQLCKMCEDVQQWWLDEGEDHPHVATQTPAAASKDPSTLDRASLEMLSRASRVVEITNSDGGGVDETRDASVRATGTERRESGETSDPDSNEPSDTQGPNHGGRDVSGDGPHNIGAYETRSVAGTPLGCLSDQLKTGMPQEHGRRDPSTQQRENVAIDQTSGTEATILEVRGTVAIQDEALSDVDPEWMANVVDHIDKAATAVAYSQKNNKGYGERRHPHNTQDETSADESHDEESSGDEESSLASPESFPDSPADSVTREGESLSADEHIAASPATWSSRFAVPLAVTQQTNASRRASRSHGRTKRKSEAPASDVSPSKRSKPAVTVLSETLSLEHLPIPEEVIQPATISQELSRALKTHDAPLVGLLTRLFYALGSPESISQLRDVCVSVRTSEALLSSDGNACVSQSMRALDELDKAACAASLLRRYHLVKLVGAREARQAFHLENDPRHAPGVMKHGHVRPRARKANEGAGRALSQALRDVLLEAYPELHHVPAVQAISHAEYRRKSDSLKWRLGRGRNWHALTQAFSMGILALVPVGGVFDIYNHDVERLSKEAFGVLLRLLVEHRGRFLQETSDFLSEKIYDILLQRNMTSKYQFESVEASDLQGEAYDSPTLLSVCTSADVP